MEICKRQIQSTDLKSSQEAAQIVKEARENLVEDLANALLYEREKERTQ